MGKAGIIGGLIKLVVIIAGVWWFISMWSSGHDTFAKQKILYEQYGCNPTSVSQSGFWMTYDCPVGTPNLLDD
jgi:hypothetical protein